MHDLVVERAGDDLLAGLRRRRAERLQRDGGVVGRDLEGPRLEAVAHGRRADPASPAPRRELVAVREEMAQVGGPGIVDVADRGGQQLERLREVARGLGQPRRVLDDDVARAQQLVEPVGCGRDDLVPVADLGEDIEAMADVAVGRMRGERAPHLGVLRRGVHHLRAGVRRRPRERYRDVRRQRRCRLGQPRQDVDRQLEDAEVLGLPARPALRHQLGDARRRRAAVRRAAAPAG